MGGHDGPEYATFGRELALYQIPGIGIVRIGLCGFHRFAPRYAAEPHFTHQPFHCAARNHLVF
jgi:hypothetical protein